MISVEIITTLDADDYRSVVDDTADALIHHSPAWLGFLAQVLADAEPLLLIARQEGRAIGAIPGFLLCGSHGAVFNSLPWFGGHGDVILSRHATEPESVVSALVGELGRFCKQADIGAANVVTHPLAPRFGKAAVAAGLAEWDSRIGQISRLVPAETREEAIEQVLGACRQRARNYVRRALKQGPSIETSDEEADWRTLLEHHALRLHRIGGRAKSAEAFAALRARFKCDRERRLYVARRDGTFVGGLLCLFYRDWVEPVALEASRREDVGRAMIAEALVDARLAGRRFWNWGGTWHSQTGVYQFKRGWGADDYRYGYYGAVTGEALAAATPSELTACYPDFYVRPFSVAPHAAPLT